MKPGGVVSYTDSKGKRHQATVTALVGTGASGNKTLDLRLEEEDATKTPETATDVPHGDDRELGKGFWLLEGEEVASATPKARRRKRGK